MFKFSSSNNIGSLIMTESIFSNIIEKNPRLTSDGFEDFSSNGKFETNRKTLLESFNEFKICCEWINEFKAVLTKKELKNYNFLKHNINSYYLKHAIEKWAGRYIPNGALIAALIYSGINYKRILGSPDVSAFIVLSRNTPYI